VKSSCKACGAEIIRARLVSSGKPVQRDGKDVFVSLEATAHVYYLGKNQAECARAVSGFFVSHACPKGSLFPEDPAFAPIADALDF